MTLGIFVEGPSDLRAIPVLIRKLGYQSRVHGRTVGQGAMLQVDKMSRHISALKSTAGRLSQILVFMDSEGVEPSETLRSTKSASKELNRLTGDVPVDYIVVDHSLEGWLACDIEALRAVLGRNARIRITGNPEDHPRPAQLLVRVFRANG